MTKVVATARRSGRHHQAKKMTEVAATARRSGRQHQAKKMTEVAATARRSGRQHQAKEIRPELSDRRMTRSASKQKQPKEEEIRRIQEEEIRRIQEEENRCIQEFPGFDVGDIPPNVFGELEFKSCWTENYPYPAPKEYEDMAKIGLETYNCQNETLYQFTKILRVYSLKKRIYAAYHITFQADDESSTKNFEAKAGSFRDVTVVPFCKLEKGLDVAAPDGDRKQTETLSDLARSAFIQQQEERRQLLREEDSRIEERRGFDFMDISPMVLHGDNAFEPCWSESSLYPAPKLYEDMSKIGIKKYNCEHHKSYQFTKLLKVYFRKDGKAIVRFISFQAEDTSVASHKNFLIHVVSVPDETMISCCMLDEGRGRGVDVTSEVHWFGEDMTSECDVYCSTVEHWLRPATGIGFVRTCPAKVIGIVHQQNSGFETYVDMQQVHVGTG